jgi:D-alanyl-D-alanine endopeptidase (penicillin-binding protein 7)
MVFNDLKVIPIKRFSVLAALAAVFFLGVSLSQAVQAKTPAAQVAEQKKAKKAASSRQKAQKSASRKEPKAVRSAKAKNAKHARQNKAANRQARLKQQRLARVPARLSTGQIMGLHGVQDPLSLSASVALVVDQSTNEVLLSKNDAAVLPIASLTKLMTGLVVADAKLSMDEVITITHDDIDTLKGSRSRLAVGTKLTRGELMHLALMSSENRAAHALGSTFPGGIDHFVSLMNHKAHALGMVDSRFVDPTGLSSRNQSSARDLATLALASYQQPIMREMSTSPGYRLSTGRKTLQYNNSNGLVRSGDWDIGLQKTGYISEAGRCLVMQATVAGRDVIMVFLDSVSKVGRLRDAERVRRWMEAQDQPARIPPRG